MGTTAAHQQALEAVADVIRESFDLAPDFPIDDETTALDIDGWDSLAHTTLLLMIEKRLDTRIDRIEFENVGELVDEVVRAQGSSST